MASRDIRRNETGKTICKDGFGKGVYGRYCSVISNFVTLNRVTEVMQRNVYVGALYPC